MVSSRKSRSHYGLIIGKPFLPDAHDESSLYFHPWTLSKMCNNRITWLIKKVCIFAFPTTPNIHAIQGQIIDDTTHVITPLWRDFRNNEKLDLQINLLCCQLDVAPDSYPNQGISTDRSSGSVAQTNAQSGIKIVGTIRHDFSSVAELEFFENKKRKDGVQIWRCPFNFHIVTRDNGDMQFRAVGKDGTVYGAARVGPFLANGC
jgi:hypothetical protein